MAREAAASTGKVRRTPFLPGADPPGADPRVDAADRGDPHDSPGPAW